MKVKMIKPTHLLGGSPSQCIKPSSGIEIVYEFKYKRLMEPSNGSSKDNGRSEGLS